MKNRIYWSLASIVFLAQIIGTKIILAVKNQNDHDQLLLFKTAKLIEDRKISLSQKLNTIFKQHHKWGNSTKQYVWEIQSYITTTGEMH